MTLAKHLEDRSTEICQMNDCTEDEHKCESYAYISKAGLLDICCPDYFSGSSEPYACIPLPWSGSQEDLDAEVENQIAEQEIE